MSAGYTFNRRREGLVSIIHSQQAALPPFEKHPLRTSHSHGKRAAHTKEAPMRRQADSRSPSRAIQRQSGFFQAAKKESPWVRRVTLRPRHRRSRAHQHANEGRALATANAAYAAGCYTAAPLDRFLSSASAIATPRAHHMLRSHFRNEEHF